mmetsp:Transcript_3995/g.9782  ORF Transcript_3995/g.9782 Transcript_3995/m.9782 type:complete len:242 (-) Transcript_3995:563-1288(-)
MPSAERRKKCSIRLQLRRAFAVSSNATRYFSFVALARHRRQRLPYDDIQTLLHRHASAVAAPLSSVEGAPAPRLPLSMIPRFFYSQIFDGVAVDLCCRSPRRGRCFHKKIGHAVHLEHGHAEAQQQHLEYEHDGVYRKQYTARRTPTVPAFAQHPRGSEGVCGGKEPRLRYWPFLVLGRGCVGVVLLSEIGELLAQHRIRGDGIVRHAQGLFELLHLGVDFTCFFVLVVFGRCVSLLAEHV